MLLSNLGNTIYVRRSFLIMLGNDFEGLIVISEHARKWLLGKDAFSEHRGFAFGRASTKGFGPIFRLEGSFTGIAGRKSLGGDSDTPNGIAN